MKLDLGKMINKYFWSEAKVQKIDEISEAARKCSVTQTGYVGKINRIDLSVFVCLFVCCFWNLWLGPVSKNLQLERTAGKNALSRINKVFANFESDFSKTKEGIAPKSREILQTFVLWGMGHVPAPHHDFHDFAKL